MAVLKLCERESVTKYIKRSLQNFFSLDNGIK